MADEEESGEPRRNRRDLLRGYYGTSEETKQMDIYDINEAYFQHEKYLDKMFKERSLHELMDKESEIIKREDIKQFFLLIYLLSIFHCLFNCSIVNSREFQLFCIKKNNEINIEDKIIMKCQLG